MAWRVLYQFEGNHTWQELNDLIRSETGNNEPFFETESDYNLSLLEGFVAYDKRENVTTVWTDER